VLIPFHPGQAIYTPPAPDPESSILPDPPVSTLHTAKSPSSPSELTPPEPAPSPKRVSKPSEKLRALRDSTLDTNKRAATIANISAYLSELEAGDPEAETHLANAFDILAAMENGADGDIPSPGDSLSMKEALAGDDADRWMDSMKEELQSIKDYGVYHLVPRLALLKGWKVLRGKFVYRRKLDANGNMSHYKSCYVFGGHRQVPGHDYDQTTTPTARMEAFCTILSFAATNDYDTQQFDVKTAFLNGILDEDEVQYMEQPKGFEEPGKEDWIWELCKGLYGMKQAGRIWNKTINQAMLDWGFKRLPCKWCIYYRKTETGIVLVAIHVDDFLSVASSHEANDEFKGQLKSRFSISEGEVDLCLGICIEHNREAHTVSLSQRTLINQTISKFNQADAYPATTPMADGAAAVLVHPDSSVPLSQEEKSELSLLPYRSLVSSLMYIAISTWPDIAFAVSKLSQFLDCYRRVHWQAAIRVLQYLKGTRNLCLLLGGPSFNLVSFSDSSWAEEESRHSHMGYCFSVGSGVVSWSSRRQATVAGSSTEVEYIAVSEASREAVWLRSLLRKLELLPDGPTTLFCDNNGAIALSFDQAFHARVKHVDVRYHFICEQVEAKQITVRCVPSAENVSDIFTKPLARPLFEKHRAHLSLV
jgi:hypothetical protein